MRFKLATLSLCAWLVIGCANNNTGRYSVKTDSAPSSQQAGSIVVEDATPRYEPYRAHNSKPYNVLGRTYYPLKTGEGYEATGLASWYGQKFHGHLTSNGETYDMFAMTAAHKTLPLPSYVKVTNLENNKSVIVRVNDRGPFHGDRIIDLSFSAAKKIGTYDNGVSKVKLEVIHVSENDRYRVGKGPRQSFAQYIGVESSSEASSQVSDARPKFIQVLASSDKRKVNALSQSLATLYQVPAQSVNANSLYKLRLGPISNQTRLQQVLNELKMNGYASAYIIKN